MNERTLVAVDPGGREIGCAVFADDELRYYGVKGIKAKGIEDAQGEAARIVRSLVAEYQPFRFALARRIVLHQPAERLAHIARTVRRTALDEGVALYERAPKAVRQFVCGHDRATKREAVEKLAARYPELRQYVEGRTPSETLYYERMFSAVATGLMCAVEATH